MAIEYPGEINALLYTLFSIPGLRREHAANLVQTILRGQYFPRGPEAYSKAIEQALAQSDPVTQPVEPPFGEARVREFLGLMYEELEKVKPWPGTQD